MAITTERLQEFIRLYEEELGEQINEEEAKEITSRLVELYSLLVEPLPSELARTVIPPQGMDQGKGHEHVSDH